MSYNILVTGGAGFIGSHTCVVLAQAGLNPVILDNLSNTDAGALRRIQGLMGGRAPRFWHGDVRDRDVLRAIFHSTPVHAVVHFAGLKSVRDSVAQPLGYYECNVQGSLTLLEEMQRAAVRRLIFSSSATVYGEPDQSPVSETAALRPCSPYGHSKRMVEQLLDDVARADPGWRSVSLRYFNPAGAHPSGQLGEWALGKPNNLVPLLCEVAAGSATPLTVHGDDYPTPDGTCMRDYVHVMDVAEGHLAALSHLETGPGASAFNLGVGSGTSVLELLQAFSRCCGKPVPHLIGPRRAGDAAAYWANVALARQTMGWTARRSTQDICADAWRWQCRVASLTAEQGGTRPQQPAPQGAQPAHA